MSSLIWLAPGLKGVNHILRKISIIFCHNIQTKTLLFVSTIPVFPHCGAAFS